MAENTRTDLVTDNVYSRGREGMADLRLSDAPTPERFFLVALGLDDWTDAEREAIARLRLAEYENRMTSLLQTQRKLLRMERELEIGRDIQREFLPDNLPEVAGWDVSAHFQPAREVSGDFYDVFPLPHEHLALVIADVCDKGVGAALYMTLFRSMLRAFAHQTARLDLFARPGQPGPVLRDAAGHRRATLLADLTALSTVELTNDYVAQTHNKIRFASVFFGVLKIGRAHV